MAKGAVLVTGGTGKTGRRVAEKLTAAGREARVATRGTSPRFDWGDPSGWASALEGVEAVYVVFMPDAGMPGAAETLARFYETAKAAGARRAVQMNGRADGNPLARESELALEKSGLDWTLVRTSWFLQNFSEGMLAEDVRRGVVALPTGPGRKAFVDAEDIADVAVAALTARGHAGRAYEVTGAEPLSFAELVAQIGTVGGLGVQFQQVSVETYRRILEEAHLPPDVAGMLADLFGQTGQGDDEVPGGGVREALNRAPRSVADFVARAAASGAWA